jgi:hypothetical protein
VVAVSDQDRPWDPDPLQVGDRVRYRHRGECGIADHDAAWNDGVEGLVLDIDTEEPYGHMYLARMGQGYLVWLARTELDRLESFARNKPAELGG